MGKLTFIVLITTSSAYALGGQRCGYVTESWGAQHAKISFDFPDGRKFELIGHNHGSTETTAQLITAVSDQTSTNEIYLKSIRALLAKDQTAIHQANVDVAYLKKKFRSNEPSFLGVEANRTNVRAGLTSWLRETMLKEFARRKIEDGFLREQVLLAFGTADGYLSQTEPGLIKHHPVIGVDSGEMETLPEIWKSEDKLFAKLMDQTKADPIWQKKFKSIQEQLQIAYPVADELSDQQISEKVFEGVPSKYRSASTAWLTEQLKDIRVMNLRDHTIVDHMLEQKKSGILLIGYAHLQSLILKLQKACNEMYSSKPVLTGARKTREATHGTR